MDLNVETVLVILGIVYLYSIAIFVVIRYFKTVIHSRVSVLTKGATSAFFLFALIWPYFQTGSLLSSYLTVTIPIATSFVGYPYALGLREDGITVYKKVITHNNLMNILGKFIAYEDTNNWTLIEEEHFLKVRFFVETTNEDTKQEILFKKEQKKEIIELLESKGLTLRLIDNDLI